MKQNKYFSLSYTKQKVDQIKLEKKYGKETYKFFDL
jgi:hypothetical protein